tara:strand:+ start:164 stop:508 length:345 start_codon:yes stop_codon:yes gene_type:complete
MAKEKDARDLLDEQGDSAANANTTNNELTTIAVKSLSNIEEKIEAMDWKLWEIYNIVKSYVEKLENQELSSPEVSKPGVSAKDVAEEVLSALTNSDDKVSEKKASVVSKLFGSK